MTQTQAEALEAFRQELQHYANREEPVYSDKTHEMAETARLKACEAHAERIARIQKLPEYAETDSCAMFGPGDAAVVVSVPSGSAPTLFRFDREGFGAGGNSLDLMVACTLLEHALNECRKAYSREASKIDVPGYPVTRPAPYPSPAPGF